MPEGGCPKPGAGAGAQQGAGGDGVFGGGFAGEHGAKVAVAFGAQGAGQVQLGQGGPLDFGGEAVVVAACVVAGAGGGHAGAGGVHAVLVGKADDAELDVAVVGLAEGARGGEGDVAQLVGFGADGGGFGAQQGAEGLLQLWAGLLDGLQELGVEGAEQVLQGGAGDADAAGVGDGFAVGGVDEAEAVVPEAGLACEANDVALALAVGVSL